MNINITKKYYGLIFSVIFSLVLTYAFYGSVIKNINNVYFGGGGDALQSYSNSLYHIKYDTSYMFQKNMNYPYGENVFYTNCQFPISNSIKFLKNIGIDLYDYTIGILNSLMLISITLSVIVLYFIFQHLKLPTLYSGLVAISIGFLSPQIHRFPGHFTLSYMFAIPFALYMLLLYYQHKQIKYSIYLGVFTFFVSLFHIYYLGLIGAIVLCFWLFLFIFDPTFRNIKSIFVNILIQLIIPFFIIKVWGWSVDMMDDRTQNPWGYLYYTSFWEGVFLPLNTPLEKYFSDIFYIDSHEYEGIAYVGVIAICMLAVIGMRSVFQVIKLRKVKVFFFITDNAVLNTFFWCGILTLIFSWGYPFKKYEELYNYIGFIKQMRGIGRFAWIFFYTINIISFYLLYKLLEKYSIWIRSISLVLCIELIFIEVYIHNKEYFHHQFYMNLGIQSLSDKKNNLDENKWINEIPLKNYQAILPLPYFHVGSESIWYSNESYAQHYTYIATVKTGLPTLGVHLSRTSLSQTYKSMALVLEPYRPLEILNDFPDKRPLLVIAKKDQVREIEKDLFNKCKLLLDNGQLQFYELSYSDLMTISDSLGIKAREELSRYSIPKNSFYSTDSSQKFMYEGFDKYHAQRKKYRGNSSFSCPADKKSIVYEGKIPDLQGQPCKLSFWISDIDKDLYARTVFFIELIKDNQVVYSDENSIFRYIQTIDHDWALFERELPITDNGLTIRLQVKNEVKMDTIFIDELLLRPAPANIYKSLDHEVYKNNRFYPVP